MKAYVFPGQGAQFLGMGKDIYDNHSFAKEYFDQANDILGFNIAKIMFEGTDDELKQTNVTQPAVFLHSVLASQIYNDCAPDCVAGHSLGEFSALVVNGTLKFTDALILVSKRASAMQSACKVTPSTMAAILGLDDKVVEQICKEISGIVVPANYNCPNQLVISGDVEAVKVACEKMKSAGAHRALILPVGGAFHSPLMEPAREELAEAIANTHFDKPKCPVYQNVDAQAHSDIEKIKSNLINQLTAPVRWTQIVHNMISNGTTEFIECGPGKVLQGLIKKVKKSMEVSKTL